MKTSKENQIWNRRKKIIVLLRKNSMNLDTLIKTIHQEEKTIRDDIHLLNLLGFKIQKSRGKSYFLEKDNSEFFSYEPITADIISKWTIMDAIRKNGPIRKCDLLSSNFQNGYRHFYTKTDIKTVNKYLETLESEKLIAKEGKRYKNISNINTISFSSNEITSFIIFCSSKGIEYNPIIEKILNYSSIYSSNMFSLSKQTKNLSASSTAIYNLYNIFSKKAISFKYKSCNSEKESEVKHFYVGKIIYSKDNDKMYLFGITRPNKKTCESFDFNQIILNSIKPTEKNNIYFNNELFQQIYLEMFGISKDPAENIKIKFTLSPYVFSKLKHLYKARHATCQMYTSTNELISEKFFLDTTAYKNAEYIIYKDTIRGLGGIANYLRQFGNNVEILEDQALIKQTLKTSYLAIKEYKKILERKSDYER